MGESTQGQQRAGVGRGRQGHTWLAMGPFQKKLNTGQNGMHED